MDQRQDLQELRDEEPHADRGDHSEGRPPHEARPHRDRPSAHQPAVLRDEHQEPEADGRSERAGDARREEQLDRRDPGEADRDRERDRDGDDRVETARLAHSLREAEGKRELRATSAQLGWARKAAATYASRTRSTYLSTRS